MQMYKVCNKERGRKMLIMGQSLEELIATAIKKFDLPVSENGYKILLEEDGTEIPDSETLGAIAHDLNGVTLMILPQDDQWVPKNFLNSSELNSSSFNLLLSSLNSNEAVAAANTVVLAEYPENVAGTSTSVMTGASTTDDNSSDQLAESHHTGSRKINNIVQSIPWQSFPTAVLDACEEKRPPAPIDYRAMIHGIANYMTYDLKDVSRTAAGKIAQAIVDKYPKSFLETCNGTVIGNGCQKLTMQIYNRVNYRLATQRTGVRSKLDAKEESSAAFKSKTKKKTGRNEAEVDQYGCVQYEPSLAVTETPQSQDEKKNLLLTETNLKKNRDDAKIKIYFTDTYPTQRFEINNRSGLIKDVLLVWPILMEPVYFVSHSETLLGKAIKQIWSDNLKNNLTIHDFMRHYVQKSKQRENRADLAIISKILSSAASTCEDLESNRPSVLAVFQLLIAYFKEDPNLLYRVVNLEMLADEHTEENVDVLSPLLLINGNSLYDPMASCAIIIEKKVCVTTNDTLDGILITILSYFVFGLKYPANIAKTLEFMQRILLDINPTTTKTKNESAGKRRTPFNPAVRGLYEKLQEWRNTFN